MDQDTIFKALADPSRRTLLDLLFQQDGRSLSDLESQLPMTRFGVMKHLRILESAGLITSEKVGREKHHYLNPVPIQLIYDRWVRKYAQPLTTRMTDLKYQLEQHMDETITHRYQIFIETTPERLWDALTNSEISPTYYFGYAVTSDWNVGSNYAYLSNDDTRVDGEIIEIDPPYKLVQTFNGHFHPEAKALGQSKVTWLIEPQGVVCKLTLIHEELKNTPFAQEIIEGWSRIVSRLKTVLEKGESLPFGT
ncbi:MAG: MarR family transcriptional regulator [Chloroflexi bacterium AL-W]|nr:MarR family transcriptional regulator [Chloroflexi bacterium AL-N1]NOK65607.1 MarR family transcriptional regulator [Chloroflexi bacterium AL-N10]NOK74452.1 MarR family transcriptional regulator [Chloroflexi bacterium AL-N5]NOK80640.1 MarR family transcriptional regulator [Chloroflexi bacterium AL-W]NOK88710.1 MarR family transcriptional regulator [Chloroflexi bacterium AL-N15]